VAVDVRPPPVVTIVDPAHPGPIVDLHAEPEASRRTPLTAAERLLTLALATLLLAGTATAHTQRAQQHVRDLVAGLRLAAVVTSAGTSRGPGAPSLVVDVALSSDETADVTLGSVEADHGWQLIGAAPRVLVHGSGASLTFEREMDCRSTVLAPEHLSLQVTVAGARTRTLDVAVAADLMGVGSESASLCGDLDAVESLVVLSSSVTSFGNHSAIAAGLANIGVQSLTVQDVRVAGFTFKPSRPLPLVVPGREPGVLRPERLVVHELDLDARVSSCVIARDALHTSEYLGAPDVIEVFVVGRGTRHLVPVEVRGIEAFLARQWQITCRA
jgi:hypothetical protein